PAPWRTRSSGRRAPSTGASGPPAREPEGSEPDVREPDAREYVRSRRSTSIEPVSKSVGSVSPARAMSRARSAERNGPGAESRSGPPDDDAAGRSEGSTTPATVPARPRSPGRTSSGWSDQHRSPGRRGKL